MFYLQISSELDKFAESTFAASLMSVGDVARTKRKSCFVGWCTVHGIDCESMLYVRHTSIRLLAKIVGCKRTFADKGFTK